MKVLISPPDNNNNDNNNNNNDNNDNNDNNGNNENLVKKLDNLLGKNIDPDILNKNIIGSIIFFIVVICLIPFILFKLKLFDILEVYFPNVDLIATSFSFNNGPFNTNMFKYLYLDGTPLIGYINQTIISYIAVMSIIFIVIRDSVVHKNIISGLSKASIICFTTYLLPNRWIVMGMTYIDHVIKQAMSGSYIWFIVVFFGLVISYLCIYFEAKLLKYFSPVIAKYMKAIFKSIV